jgi:hypothetical protein
MPVRTFFIATNAMAPSKTWGLLSGIALSSDGLQQGSMGVDWGDYLHEGRLSMIVTNFIEQGTALYHPGKDEFSDVSLRSKVTRPTHPLVGWGTAFFDVDNDGWLDLFIADGHVYPQVDTIPGGTPYRQPMVLLRNNRDGTFDDVSQTLANMPAEARRGATFGDINNDGNVDIVIFNVGAPPSLLLNRNQNPNHRVLFKLIGTKSNKAAIGARLTVKAGDLVQFSEVRGGASYLSQNPALRSRSQPQNDRSFHPLAQRRNSNPARRPRRLHLHRRRRRRHPPEDSVTASLASRIAGMDRGRD